MAAIASGLDDGDAVILNLRDHLDLMDLPELASEDNSAMRDISQDTGADTRGAGGGPPPSAGPDTGGRGGFGGQRPPGGGQGGPRGGPGGGGRPDLSTIVIMSMQRNDTDGDGKLSSSEIEAIDGQFKDGVKAADANGDGEVTKEELTKSIQARMGGGGGRP